ncbi:T9SS type A sorting domain-containing protein [Winogradskyella sp. PC D3.3]
MKNNYKTILNSVILSMAMLLSLNAFAQDIHFTFADAAITSEGGTDFYEVDVLIQTINDTGSFKLGSGQLYFTYNTAAFGENVSANNKIEFTYPDDYICGQGIDATDAAKIYNQFTVNDNTDFRVSWAFSQAFDASTFTGDNVTEIPTKLFHMKIEFTDSNEDPMVLFEEGPIYLDQFFTACGDNIPTGNPFAAPDCDNFIFTQLPNDTFDSSQATLSIADINLEGSKISIYPNPATDKVNIVSNTPIDSIEVYNILGKQVQVLKGADEVNVSKLESGIYLFKIQIGNQVETKKIVVK